MTGSARSRSGMHAPAHRPACSSARFRGQGGFRVLNAPARRPAWWRADSAAALPAPPPAHSAPAAARAPPAQPPAGDNFSGFSTHNQLAAAGLSWNGVVHRTALTAGQPPGLRRKIRKQGPQQQEQIHTSASAAAAAASTSLPGAGCASSCCRASSAAYRSSVACVIRVQGFRTTRELSHSYVLCSCCRAASAGCRSSLACASQLMRFDTCLRHMYHITELFFELIHVVV